MRGALPILMMALLGSLPAAAQAAPGEPDSSFGVGGVFTTEAGRDDYGQDVAVDAAGRTVVVGSSETFSVDRSSMAIARYTRAGMPDPSFGGDGLVLLNLGSHLLDFASGVAVDRNGRIVVAGTSCLDDTYTECFGITVIRLTGGGQLDPSFGGGDGVAAGVADRVSDVAIYPSGRIIVSGGFDGELAVFRLSAAGAFDSTFDGDGVASVDLGSEYGYGYGLALDGQGRIVAAGEAGGEDEADFAVARFLDNGLPDPSFSGDGRVVTDLDSLGNLDYPSGVVVDPYDRIDVIGTSYASAPGTPWHSALVRYAESGSLDEAFGVDGIIFGDDYSGGEAIAIDAGGRLLVASGGNEHVLLRYLPDGAPDLPFGGGDASAPIPIQIVESLAIDPWRRIVLAGAKSNGTDSDLATARLSSGDPLPLSRTLAVAVAGSGTITGPGLDCPGDCTETFASGASITLIATPSPGFTFDRWSGGCSGTGPCDLTLGIDATATATFSSQLSPSPGPAGSSGSAPSAVASVPAPRPKALKCRRGFKKRKVRGNMRCVKAKKQSRHRDRPS